MIHFFTIIQEKELFCFLNLEKSLFEELEIDLGSSPKSENSVKDGGFRSFNRFDPNRERQEQFWNTKKEHFLCVSGAKTNYNEIITNVIKKRTSLLLIFSYFSLKLIERLFSPNFFLTYLYIKELEKLLKIYTNEKDRGRMFAYKRAISTIRALKTRIETVKDVENLHSIGVKIREKIKEILQTGRLGKTIILEVVQFLNLKSMIYFSGR